MIGEMGGNGLDLWQGQGSRKVLSILNRFTGELVEGTVVGGWQWVMAHCH